MLVLLLFSLFLYSCGDEATEGGEQNEEQTVDYGKATVYTEGTPVTIVSMNSRETEALGEVKSKFFEIGVAVKSGNAFSYEAENEIIIGRVPDRAIVDKAYLLLERMDRPSYFETRYLIYADSGKIAIAYDENEYTDIQVYDYIIDEFMELAFKDHNYLALGRGVVMSGTVDLIDEQQFIDDLKVAELWKEVEALTTPEIAAALRKCYSMYDDKLIGWYANLYDPGYGGYYCTASGRDTEGFLPDPESTTQALRFIESSGMLNELEGGFRDNIPAIMGYRIVYYCKKIQHPNGYFYNPIIPKSSIDSALAKRGRDLGWCTSLLSEFGEMPTYRAANGMAGDGITADEYWDNLIAEGLIDENEPRPNIPDNIEPFTASVTGGLGDSAAVAVSKLILTSDVVLTDSTTAYLEDFELFIDYMWNLNLNGNPYFAGNELNGTSSQIATSSDKMGRYSPDPSLSEKYTKHAGKTMKEICIDILNERINPATGLWGDTSTKNPTGTEYLFTNGFFKIIGMYNSWKQPYPYPVKAANALLDGMVSDEPSLNNICEVYNIWSAIVSLRSNVKNCQPADVRDEVLGIINDTLAVRGAEAILVSYEKQLAYKKPDGGYLHHVVGSATSHQGGIPTGLGLEEGDVDAIGKATTGLFPLMLDMLDLPDIPLYTTYNWMQYLEILLELQPVQKYYYDGDASTGIPVHDFETDPGSIYLNGLGTVGTNKVYITTEGSNGVLKLEKKDNSGQLSASLYPNLKTAGADVVVFETDMKIANITKTEAFAVNIQTKGAGHNSKAARICFYPSSAANGSKITMTEMIWSGSGSAASMNCPKMDTGAVVGEWFNLKIVYYEGDINTPGTSRIKVVVNGVTIYVSDDVYSKQLDAYNIGEVLLLTMTNYVGDIYFDNTSFTQERGTWVDEPLTPSGGSGSGGSSSGGSSSGGSDPGTVTPSDPAKPTDVKITFNSSTAFPITENNFKLSNKTASGAASSTNGLVTDESGNTIPCWKGSITVVDSGTEKYLHIEDKVRDGGNSENCTDEQAKTLDVGQAHLQMDQFKGTGDMVVYEIKLRFDDLAGYTTNKATTYIDLSLRNGSTRAARLYVCNSGDDGMVRIKLDSPGLAQMDTGIKAANGEWFTVRFEYISSGATLDSNKFSTRVYINGTKVLESNATSHTYAPASAINRADFLISKSFVGVIDIEYIQIQITDSANSLSK